MFKLKVHPLKSKRYSKKLNLPKTRNYDYVLTNDPNKCEQDKINIVFSEKDIQKVNHIMDLIVLGEGYFILGENKIGKRRLNVNNIIYIESFGDEVLAHLYDDTFRLREKLYELEKELYDYNFIRVSKSYLVNIGKIKYIKPLINAKLLLILEGDYNIDVNRSYVKSFKEALKL